MGVKTIFTLYDSLNQGIKQKGVGPLLNVPDTTYTRFTFSGSDLVPLLRPEGAQKILKKRKKFYL
jgi:hypothetical protein